MKTAFMFPGQGSQIAGMGKDFYDNYPEAKDIYDRASKILDIDVCKLCFEGKADKDENDIHKTQYTQIAIATTSLAILSVLKSKGITADVAVGLSLGEYVALIYSGYLSLEDGLRLLKRRGYIMETYVPNEEYMMAAVIGIESKDIEIACEQIRKNNGGFVVPANYNYSKQTVISGNKDAVEEAAKVIELIEKAKVIKLNTSGPFHTEKLEKAKQVYEKELKKTEFRQGSIKVIKNIDGEYYSTSDHMKEILANHIISPVRFDKAIKKMQEEGVENFYEIGPGKALSGFIKKELPGVNIQTINNVEAISKI